MIQALVFDLDDTLYPERDFVMSGYRAVARHVAGGFGCNFECALSTMTGALNTRGKEAVFPALLAQFPEASIPLGELIAVYRQHDPAIQLFPGYQGLLQEFARHYRLGIITDGLPAVQARKVKALELESMIDEIIYTWEYGSEREKPHPLPFTLMLESLNADPESALFIGDNPDKDCRGAHGAGMKFAQVRYSESRQYQRDTATRESPEFIIDTLFQLPQILQQIC
jgi:putative hydrolase of the HAD superfamily